MEKRYSKKKYAFGLIIALLIIIIGVIVTLTAENYFMIFVILAAQIFLLAMICSHSSKSNSVLNRQSPGKQISINLVFWAGIFIFNLLIITWSIRSYKE